ncbi:MAG: hypothetical protein AAB552_03090 [Patescibacteria group bacterium]
MFTTKNLLFLIGRHMLFAFVSIVIAIIVIFFLSRAIERTSAKVFETRNLAHTLQKRTELFSTIRHDAEIIGTNNTLMERAFLSSGNILEFTDALETLALKTSVVQGFRFGTPQPTTIGAPFTIAAVGYDISFPANVSNLITYLKEFERLPYFTKIIGISFSSQSASGWKDSGTTSFHAVFYTKQDEL